jgi:uncharacterized protein
MAQLVHARASTGGRSSITAPNGRAARLLARAVQDLGHDLPRPRDRWALRARVLAAGVAHWPSTCALAHARSRGSLARQIDAQPGVAGLLVWPYLHAGWSPAERVQALLDHHRCIDERCPGLALAPGDRRTLATLDEQAAGLALVLDRPMWFQREGELVLNLEQGDMRLFSVAFSLGDATETSAAAGTLFARIGAVQGNSAEGMADVYRDLTKELHGMRPRDFLLDALRLLCASAGVRELRAVSDASRHHRHPFFGADTQRSLGTDYDALWAEQGGEPLGDGWVRLPLDAGVRDLESVPSKKRSMYRKRQAMLDALRLVLERQVEAVGALAHARPDVPSMRPRPEVSRWRRWITRVCAVSGFAGADLVIAMARVA